MIRKMNPVHALGVLKVTPKYAAKDLEKAIKTVLANGRNAGLKEGAFFKVLEVNESTKMRRFHAGTRGRVKPFKRRMAHIKIVLSDEIRLDQKIGKSESQNTDKPIHRNTDTPMLSDLSEKRGSK